MSTSKREPFTRVDTAWLRMEDPTNLMMSSGMMIFERPLPYEDLIRVLEERLNLHPRFRMKVVEAPLGIGSPHWQVDPAFDLRAHVHHVALPAPGGQRELERLAGDLVSTPLDFTKPPWQVHLIDGYNGGSVVLSRIHHCVADGMALVQVLWSLTDAGPRAGSAPAPAQDGREPGGPRLLRAVSSVAAHPRRKMEDAANAMSGVRALLGVTFAAPDSRTVLKGKLGVAKHTGWTQTHPLAELKDVARRLDATLNDTLVGVVGGALGEYLDERGVDVSTAVVRGALPVNLREAGAARSLGNEFGLVFAPLPIAPMSMSQRVATARKAMADIKASHLAEVSLVVLGAFGSLPASIQPMAIDFFGQKASLVLSNVPGPKTHRYLGGHRITDVMFWGPESGRLAMGIGVMSYAGHVRLGIISDAGLIPDPWRLASLVDRDLRRLRHEVAARQAATTRRRARPVIEAAASEAARARSEVPAPA